MVIETSKQKKKKSTKQCKEFPPGRANLTLRQKKPPPCVKKPVLKLRMAPNKLPETGWCPPPKFIGGKFRVNL